MSTSTNNNCIFCKIIRKECQETVIEFENDDLIIFKDIKPASDYHYLSVLKEHIDSAKSLKADDEPKLTAMEDALKQILNEKNVNMNDILLGFHWPPFTSVKHIHMHGIAPVSNMGWKEKLIFKPGTGWFCTVDYVRQWIKK